MSKVQPNFTSSNNNNNKHLLVVGATGLTGRPAVELFGKMGWNVTATSRRTLDYPVASPVTHIPCDLLNDELCQKTFQSEHFHSCTHIIYCALFENMNRTDNIDYFLPIIADAAAGFGGPLNVFELMKNMIEVGASGVHFEDQLSSEKKCGHLGGKVLVATSTFERTLNSAR